MQVVAIFGPTAVGKTAVAVALAQRLRDRGEDPVAISCDALQVYEGLSILTGVASAEQQQQLEHRMVGFLPVTELFSLGDYMPLAHAEIDAALASSRRPIVIGGTGLYMRAALADLSLRKDVPKGEASELWSPETRHPTTQFGLTMERSLLYDRIDERVQTIAKAGATEEVERAIALGASLTARKALGFEDLPIGQIGMMKKRTRNYARRQLTWMRKMSDLNEIDMTERTPEQAAAEIEDTLFPGLGGATALRTAGS